MPLDAPGCVPCLLSGAQAAVAEGRTRPHDGSARIEVPLRVLGDYDLLREIGRGGMGVVYEARQRSLNRRVALKIILAGEFASETTVARFREEAEMIGRLNHPNIVPIYEVGEHQGWHFYSMKLIEGQTLAASILHRPGRAERASSGRNGEAGILSPPALRQTVELFSQVCRAVHFAHERRIIHLLAAA